MKSPACLVVVALCAVLSSSTFAAETKPATPSTAAAETKSELAGNYTGSWKGGGDQGGGKLRIKLTRAADAWTAEADFTYQDAPIVTKVKSLKVEGARVVLVVSYELEGNQGESRLTGELSGNTLKGTFETAGDGGTGTWSVVKS